MTVSQEVRTQDTQPTSKRVGRSQLTTLILLSLVFITGVIVTAWFAGQGNISDIFAQLNRVQESPPFWLHVPMVAGEYLLVPTVALLAFVLVIMQVSPRPERWSRWVVVGVLLILTVRYLLWRSLSTLNLSTPLNGVFSLGLFVLELLMLTSTSIQLFLMLNVKNRRKEADVLSQDVLEGRFLPAVDVLIPTYDEPEFILRRTVIGCQAMDYPNKRVYLLDDTRRPEIAALAAELGCNYLTRPDNRHAKAGNLNHALGKTQGDLLVIFDADFVPTKNFLIRTVGFFQDETVALLQTPQSFYNADPIARNLGLENVLTPEEEVFYRQIQPMRDAAGSVICAGTSFIVRRRALEATGGFVTDSLSEDYFTGIKLSAQGYRLIYLDEKLSAGLAAENMASHALQRIRWARGTLQAFFIQTNPLTIRGLRPIQRLAHLEGLLHWFTSLCQVGFLMVPFAYSFGLVPLRTTADEVLYYFLPYYVVQLSVFSWLNYRSRSAILSNIYNLALAFPLALTVIQAMLSPFSKGFKVTPKGTASDRFTFNWGLAWPLIIMFIATAVTLWLNLGTCLLWDAWGIYETPEMAVKMKGFGMGWVWSVYNLIMLGIALLILLDVPRPHPYEWFDLRRTIRLRVGSGAIAPSLTPVRSTAELHSVHGYSTSLSPEFSASQTIHPGETNGFAPAEQVFWGVTSMISEVGAEIELTQAGFPTDSVEESRPITVEILEEGLTIPAQVIQFRVRNEFPTVRVLYQELSLPQQRRIVEMLFCRPGQWKSRCTPGELRSLLLLFQILLRPKVLFRQDLEIKAIAVSKV
jgi:cellulose synthase (UDP-forming)